MNHYSDTLLASGFVTGAIEYKDFYIGESVLARIVIPILAEGRTQPLQAIVDTSAQWSVFDPALIQTLGLDIQKDHESEKKLLMIRGTVYEGRLIRIGVILKAEYGNELDIDATVFVPLLEPDDEWPWPNFLGMDGLLDRIRFAVDPAENMFYFGAV